MSLKKQKRLYKNIIDVSKKNRLLRFKNDDSINIPSLIILDKKINKIRNNLNLLDIMDLNNKINDLKLYENVDEDNEINEEELFKQAQEANNDFYDSIDNKLQIAEETINNLIK